MFTSTSNTDLAEAGAADVLIPLIRAAATISFAIAPCSLGFVIIAVSEQLIRAIMVGNDPEMLLSDLQNQFPNAAIEINENYDAGMVAKVVDLIERPEKALGRRNSVDYWPRRVMGANNGPPLCFHLGLLNAAISLFALRESNRARARSVKHPGSPIISPASTGSMVAKSIVQFGKDRSSIGSRLIVIT